MNAWEAFKANRRDDLKVALFKALPWGVGLFVVLVVFVKVFSVAALVATIKHIPLFVTICVIVATPATIILMVIVVGGAFKSQFDDSSSSKKPEEKKLVTTEAKMEASAAAKPAKQPTAAEPPLEGFAALWYWLFSRDNPEAK